ncbi:hypothetical protein X762_23835 [Mesorhizobium sp. LSHC426A00]|nr:hypothetical protein X767_05275 [Mesorhizobium sp. LSJC264A00]ESX46118.1 hypothetical protein X762_23835 [Mesorhizobium sp. LSHC426A00]ESX69109.1 hypothetical protein X758_20070 [Mesorhizobium sp. LSHC416B00]ESY39164.1 hypothetical protein X748_05010 [Mesorhizobium sp. LNJC386A00]ESZ31850.1 hypothetical protein X733_20280 [Mesorhizobium sp. L2C067A000]ESZ60857.1 hypothetical protein X729_14830 [Mesorhizobium sp. L103C131B0]
MIAYPTASATYVPRRSREMKDMITHIYKGLECFLLECSAALVRRRALGGSRSDPRQLREQRRDEFRARKGAE